MRKFQCESQRKSGVFRNKENIENVENKFFRIRFEFNELREE